jgi:hypothetical protein
MAADRAFVEAVLREAAVLRLVEVVLEMDALERLRMPCGGLCR